MDFQNIKKALFAEADRLSLTEYEVYYKEEKSISTDAYKGEIKSFASEVHGGLCFRCIKEGKMGYASSEELTEEAVVSLVEKAIDNALSIESDDKAIIFPGSKEYVELPASTFTMPSAAELKEFALSCQKELYATSDLIADGSEAGAGAAEVTVYLANSHGLELSTVLGYSLGYAEAVIKEGEVMNAAYDTYVGDLKALDQETFTRKITDNAIAMLNTTLPDSGKYDIIFSGKQMINILSTFLPVFSASQAQKGLSLLKGKEGEVIASSVLTLMDDPFYADSPVKTAFDGEGVATFKKAVIENGRLNTLLYNLAAAEKEGKESTGNGYKGSYASAVGIAPYNFYVVPGEYSEDALFEKLGDGIYVTEMKGFHAGADPVTGDFSIESAGFLVKDGKKAEAVRSFTVAVNFFDFLRQIDSIGDIVAWSAPSGFTRFGSPMVLVKDLSVAGK